MSPRKGRNGGSVREAKHDKSKPIISQLDIVTEILSRLPLKTLSRFQLVCKEWQAVIHDRYLLEKHMAHTKYIQHFYNKKKRGNPSTREPKPDTFSHIDGCDGLLIFMNNTSYKYFLWNPAICRVLELPDPHTGQYDHKLALLYVPASKNYRIVSMYADKESGERGCEVLTPGLSMSWRPLTFPDTLSANKHSKACVVSAGGAVHCVLITKVGHKTISEIVTLDVATECFTINLLPDGIFCEKNKVWRLDWDGKLAFVDIVEQNLQLVELEDCTTHKWSEKKMISLPFLKEDGVEGNAFPLFNKQGDIWFWLKHEKIFSYSIQTGRVTDILKLGDFNHEKNFYPYKPSLVCFRGMQPDTFFECYRRDIDYYL